MTRNAKKTAAASKTDSSSDEESITSKSSRGVEVIPESGKKDTDKEAPKADDAGPSPAPTRSDKPDLPSGARQLWDTLPYGPRRHRTARHP